MMLSGMRKSPIVHEEGLERLNEAQRRAVVEGDGPALVLAGAGTGKTRVIVERLAWLVTERGIHPRHLLALTFTNRAAREMRTRVAARLGTKTLEGWLGTFHAFSLYVLRRHIGKLGRAPAFTVFDDADQLTLVKRLVRELGPGWTKVVPREALTWIGARKQDLVSHDWSTPAATEEEKTCRELWARYHRALEANNGLDFDDLLLELARLLEANPDLRERYQRQYAYVHVDEYQDTNRAQYWILRYLTDSHHNLFVVGDEDQNIYSWRGASLQNILDFEKDFPDARIFRLEQNYRSTAPILAASNVLAARNRHRLGKTLWTTKDHGEPVRVHIARDGEDEARFVVEEIRKNGLAPQGVAVLFRTNGQARLLEEALSRHGLAYVVVGGIRFYHHKEVKDLLSYLRVAANPANDVALERILNVPTRGIGLATVERLREYAATRHQPLFQVLRELEGDQTFPGRTRAAVGEFVGLMNELASQASGEKVAAVVESVLEKTAYRDYVRNTDARDFRTGLETIEEFLAACTSFDRRGSGALHEFLQEAALLTDVDEWDAGSPAVALMTFHGAKGLEFDHVFLVGLEEGVLPHASALSSELELEEERRLCYVAMTRARKTLMLVAAKTRSVHGEYRTAGLSRFVEDLLHEKVVQPCLAKDGWTTSPVAGLSTGRLDPQQLKMGTQVRHAKFGAGTVMYTTGSGPKLRARIRFHTGRTRDFMVSVAPLEIMEVNTA
jgi:DNA helicase-2/ATP-dependent DNA helicase PcrA